MDGLWVKLWCLRERNSVVYDVVGLGGIIGVVLGVVVVVDGWKECVVCYWRLKDLLWLGVVVKIKYGVGRDKLYVLMKLKGCDRCSKGW